MLGNYLKVGLRTLYRNKGYTLINTTGLATALACGFIIMLFVLGETSFDSCHDNYDRIGRVVTEDHQFDIVSPGTPLALAPIMVDQFPEVERVSRSKWVNIQVQTDEQSVSEWAMGTDPDLFSIFTMPLLRGDRAAPMSDPNSMVISESVAEKYFGEEDPLGKTMPLSTIAGRYQLTVTGVIRDPSRHSSIQARIFVPLDIAAEEIRERFPPSEIDPLSRWDMNFFATYLLLRREHQPSEIEARFPAIAKDHHHEQMQKTYSVQPMSDFYLYSDHLANNGIPQGNITNVYVFSLVAILILVIAGLNFVILATARSAARNMEIGMRKVAGACRPDLVRQILCESLLSAFVALPVAIVLVEVSLPYVNQLFGIRLVAHYLENWQFTVGVIAVTAIVGLAAGAYVAFYMSSSRPIDVLKASPVRARSRYSLRRCLIVVQLTIFVSLITCTGIVYKQLRYAKNADMGFDSANLLTVDLNSNEGADRYNLFKSQIEDHPGVISVSGASYLPPTDSWSKIRVTSAHEPPVERSLESMSVDYNIVSALGLQIVDGRDFELGQDNPNSRTCLLNEAAVTDLGLEIPIGHDLNGITVVGVVKDFHIHSFRNEIGPVALTLSPEYVREMLIRLDSKNTSETMAFLEKTWAQVAPDEPFYASFFDQTLGYLYEEERKFGNIIGYFTMLAIFVACLGLVGLSSFLAQRRTKEIGIRKVLGAPVLSIVGMLSGEFAVLVLVAGLIGWPISHYFMSRWLENFAYRTDIGIIVPATATVLGLVIALLTVSFQSFKAARANPVESLRHE